MSGFRLVVGHTTVPETIALVQELAQTAHRVAAENHFDYLVCMKRSKEVKNHGHAVKAQPTTTKRTQITIDQQPRWHVVVEEALEFQKRVSLPEKECEQFQDYFLGNLDKTCLMAYVNGAVRVTASQGKKKTKKNANDSRISITSLRIGLASGFQGPFTFLAKGTRMDRPSINTILKERCPSVS